MATQPPQSGSPSMPIMPSEEDLTSRERVGRIGRRDYFKEWNWIKKWKALLSVAGLLAAFAFVMPGLLGGAGRMQYNHGPVCEAHAGFEGNCEACHEPYRPINQNTWLHDRLFGVPAERWRNLRCQGCHGGPEHHTVKAESEQNCGSCHRDHQGRNVSLVNLPSSDCLRCHTDLAAHLPEGVSAQYRNVTGFGEPDQHPDFPRVTTRTLKFSHAVHMMPGQIYTEKQQRGMRWRDLIVKNPSDPKDPTRLWLDRNRDRLSASESEPVQLDCASCHQLDPAAAGFTIDKTFEVGVPRPSGEYYLPIAYERHCQVCHELDGFDLEQPDMSVRHGVPLKVVREELEENYTTRTVADKPWMVGPPPIKIDRLDHPWPSDAEKQSVRKEVSDAVARAERLLLDGNRGCVKCHDSVSDSSPLEVKPTHIPTIYFTHAKFNHVAHRAMDCKSCHSGAYEKPPSDMTKLIEKTPLDLPGIDNCVKCHGPQRTISDGKMPESYQVGGVAYRCTECHLYHNGAHALEGIGAPSWDAHDRQRLERFLRGDK